MKRLCSLLLTLSMTLGLILADVSAAALPFKDVPADAWYYGAVSNAYEMGLISGKSADTFGPNDNMTYAEAVTLAAGMHRKHTGYAMTPADDGPWYQTYVNYAWEHGIIARNYDWGQQVTRAGYMEIFAKALPDYMYGDFSWVPDNSIPDVPMTHPQAEAIYRMYRGGIVSGTDEAHSCSPNANIKRCEVAVILRNMMNPDYRVHIRMESIDPLCITVQPQDQTFVSGGSVTFRVEADKGKAPYKYTWESRTDSTNWTREYDSTSATLTKYPNSSMVSAGLRFRCTVTDAEGTEVVSREALVKAQTGGALRISRQPENIPGYFQPGGQVTFSVGVEGGTPPYSYQWQMKSVFSYKGEFSDLDEYTDWAPGYNTANLTVPFYAENLEEDVRFRCIVTDASGESITSEAARFEGAYLAPLIEEQPKNHVLYPNRIADDNRELEVDFYVKIVGGVEPYSYQWQYIHDGLSTYKNFSASESWATNWDDWYMTTTSHPPFSNTKFRCIITDAQGMSVISDPCWTEIVY